MSASKADVKPLVVVRADASPSIGLGHVMRSLTLARALAQHGCDVRFVGARVPDVVRTELPRAVQLTDRQDVAGDEADAMSVLANRPDLVVVDGYHISTAFFEVLESAGVRYAVIDDNAETAARSPAAVLNQNPHATVELYADMESNPILLLGLEYALIRPAILAAAQLNLSRRQGDVFVSMGGTDPKGLTVPIAEHLVRSGLRVKVAVGPGHSSRDQVSAQLSAIEGVVEIDPGEYAATLATSEVAVLAAGSSLWEAACLRTPTVAVLVAENQRAAARWALRNRLVFALHDSSEAIYPTFCERIAESAVSGLHRLDTSECIIDGRGPVRASDAFQGLFTRVPSRSADSELAERQFPEAAQ